MAEMVCPWCDRDVPITDEDTSTVRGECPEDGDVFQTQ